MVFNSFLFAAIFLPITLLLFWLSPADRAKRGVLLSSSLLYYGYLFPLYLILLCVLVGIAWGCALLVERTQRSYPVWIAAVSLLGVLAYFKYAGFFLAIAQDIGIVSLGQWHLAQVALPLGISFIVFQALGYVIDTQREVIRAEKRYTLVLLFKAFFPQLIAGPICRAHELMPQLTQHFQFRAEQFFSGLAIFAIGFFLKEVFADGLAPLVDALFSHGDGWLRSAAWAAAVGFGGQIYADFWGYSTMAVGLARLFGINIPVNFNLPYVAVSLRDFWRRWHITLSQWLRDYLYKPLGGSRHGLSRTCMALMTTMLLGGVWHGANYTFIVWGAIHGLLLVIEHAFRTLRPKGLVSVVVGRGLGWAYTFLAVTLAWVFFRASDVGQAADIISAMFVGGQAAQWSRDVRQIFFIVGALFVVQIPIEYILGKLRSESLAPGFSAAITFWSIVAAIVFGAPATVPFIYFQF